MLRYFHLLITGRDEQYKCIVFEQIMSLVPNFVPVLSEFHRNSKLFGKFVKDAS